MDIVEDLMTTTFSNNQKFFEKAANEIKSLRNQLAECQKDAERYRWLKNNVWNDDMAALITLHANESWDAAIDSAISEKG
jgi:hypothetical protein